MYKFFIEKILPGLTIAVLTALLFSTFKLYSLPEKVEQLTKKLKEKK